MKKRGPLKGDKRVTGRPKGTVTVKGRPVPMTMGAISMFMQGTKL